MKDDKEVYIAIFMGLGGYLLLWIMFHILSM